MSREDESLLREQRASVSERPTVSYSGEDAIFVDEQCEVVKKWIESNSSDQLSLPACNSFLRLLLYQQIHLRFKGVLITSKSSSSVAICSNDGTASDSGPKTFSNGSKHSILSITRATNEEIQKAGTDEAAEFEKTLFEGIGFRHVIDHLISRNNQLNRPPLPIIGHNCFLDLCHLYQKFYGNLPHQLGEFKEIFAAGKNGSGYMFPIVLDTKYMARFLASSDVSNAFPRESGLQDLFFWIQRDLIPTGKFPVSISPPDVVSMSDKSFHDAGFDALCTGLVFVGLAQQAWPATSSDVGPNIISRIRKACDLYSNRLNLMQSDFDSLRLDFAGEDNPPDRSRVVFFGPSPVSSNHQSADILSRITTSTLQQTYSDCMPIQSSPVHIMWGPQGTSVFMILEDQILLSNLISSDFVRRAIESVTRSRNMSVESLGSLINNFILVPYSEYRNMVRSSVSSHSIISDQPPTSSFPRDSEPIPKRRLVKYDQD